MLGVKATQLGGRAGHQGGGGVLGKPGGKEFLVGIAQALWLVDDEHALLFGAFEHIGGIDILGVEGGILAHQDHIQFSQWLIEDLA